MATTKAANTGNGYPSGMKNVIVNGKFQIDQRNAGAAQTITAAASLAYTADRWYAYCTGANTTGQRIAVGALNRYRITGATSVTAVGFGQRIEAVNSMHMAGVTCTLSAKLSSTSLTSVTWTAYYANTTDTFGTLASPTRTQFATGTFTITSTETLYSANVTVSASATTGIEIVFTGGALVASQTLIFGDVQLELGPVATPFEHRPFGTELSLCQRYYEKSFNYGVVPGVVSALGAIFFYGSSDVAGSLLSNGRFIVQKRTTPTMTFYNGSTGTVAQVAYSRSGDSGTTTAIEYQSGAMGYGVYAALGVAFITGNLIYHYTASAEL